MGTILSAILGAVTSFLVKLFTSQQDRKDKIELGQERQRAATLEKDAAARKRVQQAEAKPRGDEEVKKGSRSWHVLISLFLPPSCWQVVSPRLQYRDHHRRLQYRRNTLVSSIASRLRTSRTCQPLRRSASWSTITASSARRYERSMICQNRRSARLSTSFRKPGTSIREDEPWSA